MILDDRLAKDTRELERRKNLPPNEEEEEYYTYTDRKKEPYLNEGKSVFSVHDRSINTSKSVFDRTAVFSTEKRKDNNTPHRIASARDLSEILGRVGDDRIR
ncbi:MAG: hypothetical protein J6O55_08995 [Lachnospiraceae bacterium]|nr:hypothetical protein [Lachnospiraceae bacterium]